MSLFDQPIPLPEKASTARHIVIKPNLGYAAKAPAVVRGEFLGNLLAALRMSNPRAAITVVEGVCTSVPFADVMEFAGIPALCRAYDTVLADADTLPLTEYRNQGPVRRFKSLFAPTVVAEADLFLSVSPFKKTILNDAPLFSGTIKNLFGLLPREKYKARSPHSRGQLHRPSVHHVICDVYYSLGPYVHWGIIDLDSYFISKDWKPDRGRAIAVGRCLGGAKVLAVDLEALEVVGEKPCLYQKMLLEDGIEGRTLA